MLVRASVGHQVLLCGVGLNRDLKTYFQYDVWYSCNSNRILPEYGQGVHFDARETPKGQKASHSNTQGT